MKPRILNLQELQNEMKELKSVNVIDDCNNLNLDTGIYYCTGTTKNTPYSSAWFLQFMKYKTDNGDIIITQIAYRYRQNMVYIRQYNSVDGTASWKEWADIIDDTGWKDLSLSNGWQNIGGNYPTAQFRRINSQVFLRGIVTNKTSSPETLTKLPDEIKPVKIVYATIIESDTVKSSYIDTDGNIMLQNYARNNWVDISQISYFID